MTPDAPERLAALRGASAGEDLVSGARLRTRRALDAAARSAAGAAPAEARPRWRMRPGLAVAVSAVLLAGGGVAAWRAWPQEPAVLVTLDGAAGSGGSGATGTAAPAEVVVHVVGQVRRPGVVRLPSGSRVTDALDAAGGATADADLAAVNLARLLADGEQVMVPGPHAGEESGTDELDLNSADAAALDALPGIGPVLAARIVAWRTEHGRFSSVDELAEVSGIGPALLDGVRGLVRV